MPRYFVSKKTKQAALIPKGELVKKALQIYRKGLKMKGRVVTAKSMEAATEKVFGKEFMKRRK